MKDDTILVTGAAGFIGFHVAQRLLSLGREVVGLDSVNDYYASCAEAGAARCPEDASPNSPFVQSDLADREATKALFVCSIAFPIVIHLAAQAGVRYSLVNPHALYADANIEEFSECA